MKGQLGDGLILDSQAARGLPLVLSRLLHPVKCSEAALPKAGFNRASVQTGNKDDLLSLDFGLRDWDEHDPQEIVRKYREFVYETGAVDARPVKCSEAALSRGTGQDLTGQGKGARIEQKLVDRERKRKYKVSRTERFLYRSRYFTDAGIIGSKEFVGEAPVKWQEI